MKAYRFLIILLVVIIALPFTGRLFWVMKKSKAIDLIVINKSVNKGLKNEVAALNWTLNFNKFVDSAGYSFNYDVDYLGYYPDAVSEDRKIKTFKLEEITSIVSKNDALIFIDNKGVEFTKTVKKTTKKVIYGGFNQSDYFLLKEMLNKQKLVIAEYNFFSPPTEDLVRYNTEQFLDVYSLGWSGKYFNDLSKDKISEHISSNWFDLYRQNFSSDWDFNGPGIVLMNQEQSRILVLPSEKYMSSDFPVVITSPEVATEYNLPQKASYDGWFDVAFQGKNKVLSHFNLNLNQEGIDLLRKNGIESEFPAVIESINKKFYYIAGDFSKGHVFLSASKLGFITGIIRNMNKGKVQNPDKFFRVYYDYLLSEILNTYYKEISGK